ncbi:MAG: UvrD-helicase domain-containing protein, partial [Desulfarculaceae bacterium]
MRGESQALDTNLCLTAGAGAGKTRRLVQTYLDLLQGTGHAKPLDPEQIVAITFTERAADEMRTRVMGQVAQMASEGGRGRDWQELLARLEWAPISTIHGFCAAILREFGTSLGLDPDFQVMDADQFSDLLAQIIGDLLREALAGTDLSPNLARLLRHYSFSGDFGLPGILASIYAALSTMGASPKQARQRTAQAHAQALETAPGLVQDLGRIIPSLPEELQARKINPETQYGRKMLELGQKWPELAQDLLGDPLHQSALAQMDELCKGNWSKAKDLKDQIRQTLDLLLSLRPVPAAAALADDLLVLVQEVSQRVDTELHRLAALSFDHLLLGTRELLLHDRQALQELRGRWQALLIDEYQDVNPVQGQIAYLLAGMAQPPGWEPRQGDQVPKLMVVGDRKQSIYAFRGADVGLFSRTMAEFESGAEAGQVQALPNNFRSCHQLVEFFNRLFGQVFEHTAAPYPESEVFVRFRPDDEQQPARSHPQGLYGHPLEIIKIPGPEDLPLAAWRELEAKALARYLKYLVEDKKVPPGHIAVLFRRLTQVKVYEQALSQAGIDYYTVRGQGYYGCQEISDLLMALKVVLQPGDDLALASFLRSPLAGLSDESLLCLCYAQPPQRMRLSLALEQEAVLPEGLGQSQQRRWQRACRLIKGLTQMARRLQPAELLEYLLEATDLIPILLPTPGGEQKAANIRKLIEMARDPEPGQAQGAEAFCARLQALVESPPQEAQAPLMGEEAQVVRFITVHQAKGLQFPVVVLPDLAGQQRQGDRLPPPGPGGLVGIAPRDPATHHTQKTSIYNELRDRERASQDAEIARLFYVACTRAEEKLVFCLNQAKKQGPWGKWVQDMVRGDPLCREVDTESLPSSSAEKSSGLALSWPGLLPPEPGPKQEEGRVLVRRCLEPEPMPCHLVRLSVSAWEDWFKCPRLFYFTNILGLDLAALPALAAKDSQGPAYSARLGSLVHQ